MQPNDKPRASIRSPISSVIRKAASETNRTDTPQVHINIIFFRGKVKGGGKLSSPSKQFQGEYN